MQANALNLFSTYGFQIPPEKIVVPQVGYSFRWLGVNFTLQEEPEGKVLHFTRDPIPKENDLSTKRAVYRFCGRFTRYTGHPVEEYAATLADLSRAEPELKEAKWDSPLPLEVVHKLQTRAELMLSYWEVLLSPQRYPDLQTSDFYLFCDASKTGLGAVLVAKLPEAPPRVVLTYARLFQSSKISWHSNRKEAFVILRMLQLLLEDQFLPSHSRVVICSDNRSAIFLLETEKDKMPKGIAQLSLKRMRQEILLHLGELRAHGVKVEYAHTKGDRNLLADALSRVATQPRYIDLKEIWERQLNLNQGKAINVNAVETRANKRLRSKEIEEEGKQDDPGENTPLFAENVDPLKLAEAVHSRYHTGIKGTRNPEEIRHTFS